ncbi:MAG: alpha/beta fold hydrolase [Planctomycetota bacterium]|nr:MAG: alpha/beta fold hydrolase [Planctomycetota bacterium]
MRVSIPGPSGVLEGELWSPVGGGPPRAACAVCHPHPQHGGTLDSSVVFRVARGLQAAGLAALRFNFRGVGASAGSLPADGEAQDDLSAALDWLAERLPGTPLWAAGYSFGALTAGALAARQQRIERVVLVALPVLAYPLDALAELRTPGVAVMAGGDEYGTATAVRERLPAVASALELEELAGADHFFTGATEALEERVRAFALRSLEPTT